LKLTQHLTTLTTSFINIEFADTIGVDTAVPAFDMSIPQDELFDHSLLLADGIVAFLTYPVDEGALSRNKQLYLVLDKISIIPQLAGLHWQRLIAGQNPDEFGLIGYTDEHQVFWLKANVIDSEISFEQPYLLPLNYLPQARTSTSFNPSPTGEYFYLLDSITSQHVIYSLKNQRIVWSKPEDSTEGLIQVMWITNGNRIALISTSGQDTRDTVMAVYTDGTSQPFLQLTELFGADAIFWSGIELDQNRMIFWVINPLTGLADANTRLIVYSIIRS
jgi:hypothetical protein